MLMLDAPRESGCIRVCQATRLPWQDGTSVIQRAGFPALVVAAHHARLNKWPTQDAAQELKTHFSLEEQIEVVAVQKSN